MNESIDYTLALVAFTRGCRLDAGTVSGLVDAGALEPIGAAVPSGRFHRAP